MALLLTVLGLAWVILTASPASPRSQPRPEGGEVSRDLSDRLEAELYLLTNATGFFVRFASILTLSLSLSLSLTRTLTLTLTLSLSLSLSLTLTRPSSRAA